MDDPPFLTLQSMFMSRWWRKNKKESNVTQQPAGWHSSSRSSKDQAKRMINRPPRHAKPSRTTHDPCSATITTIASGLLLLYHAPNIASMFGYHHFSLGIMELNEPGLKPIRLNPIPAREWIPPLPILWQLNMSKSWPLIVVVVVWIFVLFTMALLDSYIRVCVGNMYVSFSQEAGGKRPDDATPFFKYSTCTPLSFILSMNQDIKHWI